MKKEMLQWGFSRDFSAVDPLRRQTPMAGACYKELFRSRRIGRDRSERSVMGKWDGERE